MIIFNAGRKAVPAAEFSCDHKQDSYLFYARIVFIVFLFQGCNAQEKYVNDVLRIIKKHSINRKNINWRKFTLSVKQQSKGNQTTDDSYRTINYSLKLLEDKHSFFVTPDRLKELFGSEIEMPTLANTLMHDKIAYIQIPSFIGNDSLCLRFASKIQHIIRSYDSAGVSRWIIDLRDNQGGNMWPMFLGLAPLLGPGVHGYFIDPDKRFLPWSYSSGAVHEGKKEMQRITDFFSIDHNKKIAVLIGANTASSGEAIAICFKELSYVRFFGEKTFGLTSSNSRFVLSDHAELYLTVSRFCDRKKRTYYSSIEPDETFSDSIQVMEAAANWLK